MKKTTSKEAEPAFADMPDLLVEGQEPAKVITDENGRDITAEYEDKSASNKDQPVSMVNIKLPDDVYYAAGDKEFERLLPYLIGTESTKKLSSLALGRNTKPVAILRQGIAKAINWGGFDTPAASKQKRTGNDDRPEHPDNARMRAVLGDSVYGMVVTRAKNRQATNLSMLYHGVAHALSTGSI